MELATVPAAVPRASQEAWAYYLECLDAARARMLNSPWARDGAGRAQAAHNIHMLAAFGFNVYTAPRQAYPNFYLQTIFLPFESGFGAPCPDFHYRWTFLDGARDYRIHGRVGSSRWTEFQAQRGFWGDEDQKRIGNWDFDDFAIGSDGRFEIIVSPREHAGNWIRLPEDCRNVAMMVRDALYDWQNDRPMELHIEHIGREPQGPVAHSEAEMDRRLRAAGRLARFSVDFFIELAATTERGAGGRNAFWAVPMHSSDDVGGNPRAGYVQMMYDLAPDEALIIEVEIPKARYWSVHLADPYWQTTDYTHHHSSLNGHQAHVDADGRVRIVVAAQDPGAANWLDPVDQRTGLALWRWYLADAHPLPAVRKVPAARVLEHLPADTRRVTPQQRRETIAARAQSVLSRYGF